MAGVTEWEYRENESGKIKEELNWDVFLEFKDSRPHNSGQHNQRCPCGHITMTCPNLRVRRRTLKFPKKNVTYKGMRLRLESDFSFKTT